MSMIKFVPDSAKASFNFSVGGNPRFELAGLQWAVRLAHDESVELKSGGDLKFVTGTLQFSVGEPETFKALDGSSEPAHGSIAWRSNPNAFYISLKAPPTHFVQLCGLAERGLLPAVLLQFKEASGIVFGNSPNGELKLWENVKAKHVPVVHYQFGYRFSYLETENSEDDDDE
jgi:hypothetical protein